MKALLAARNLRGKTGVSAIVLQHIARLAERGYAVDVVGEKLDRTLVEAEGGRAVKLKRLPGWPEYVVQFAYMPDGRLLAATSAYRIVVVDPATGNAQAFPVN